MARKPQDMLEFLRRQNAEENVPPEGALTEAAATAARTPAEPLEPTARVLVLRRSQVVVSCIAGGLLLLLVFLVGLRTGQARSPNSPAASPAGAPLPFWVIRVVTYKDSEQGWADARRVKAALQEFGQVTFHKIVSTQDLVVALCSWLEDPREDRAARELLERVRTLEVAARRDFGGAHYWQIQR
ncbi:MAG: hypothetical protein ACT4PV_14345 [Planctomycetaceae bacterium]